MKDRVERVMRAIEKTAKQWAWLLIALGLLAVILPIAPPFRVNAQVRWILPLGGLAYLATAYASRLSKVYLHRLFAAIAYLAGGARLLATHDLAYSSIGLTLASVFGIECILEFAAYLKVRGSSRSRWILFNAIMALLLAYSISLPLVGSSTWSLGTILGAKLMAGGVSRLMRMQALRRKSPTSHSRPV